MNKNAKPDVGAPAPPSAETRPPANSGAGPVSAEPSFRKSASRFLGDENGQAMVEFTIVSTMILFLTLGTIQFALNANASYMVNLGNFYAMRTGAVTIEYDSANIPGYDLQNDTVRSARYFMMPSWWYEGDILATLMAANSVESSSAVDLDDFDVLRTQTTFKYYMTMPIARNVIGAAMAGWGDSFAEDFLTDDGKKAALIGQSGLWMVNDQHVLTAEIASGLDAALSLFHESINLELSNGSLGADIVMLAIGSDARYPATADDSDPGLSGTENMAHRMVIQRRAYNGPLP